MRKIFIFILASVTAISLLTGCQKTPEKAVVIGKDLAPMLAKAVSDTGTQKGSLKERLHVPEHYKAALADEKGNFKVTVDADIVLPDAEKIPVIRVKARSFDTRTINLLISRFFDEGKFYEPEALSELTKTEIAETLTKLKLRRAELKKQGMEPLNPDLDAVADSNASGDGEEYAMMANLNPLDCVNESILSLEERLKTAPDIKKLVEIPDLLEKIKNNFPQQEKSRLIYASQLNPKGGMRTVHIANDPRNACIEYVNRRDFDPSSGFYSLEESWLEYASNDFSASILESVKSMPFPAITQDNAKSMADEFLKTLGIDYLICGRIDKVIGSGGSSYGDGTPVGNILKAYRLQYIRKINGVPVTHTDVESAWSAGDNMHWMWSYEKLWFIIDDNGIAEIKWEAPYELKDTLTDNASVLAFPEIKDIFEKKIMRENPWFQGIARAEMDITKIRLGLMRIVEQDSQDTGLLIPVWDFFGTITTYTEENGKTIAETHKDPALSFLTINAIDGATIDRQAGY